MREEKVIVPEEKEQENELDVLAIACEVLTEFKEAFMELAK